MSLQRRTVAVLFAAQVFAGLGTGAGISIGSLLAYEVTSNEGLAGLSRVIAALSVAALAVPLAQLASRRGRRVALSLGWIASAIGALVLVASVALHSLILMMVGMFAFAAGSAASLQTRFAATDLAHPSRTASTLSLVVWASTVGAVLGPNLAAPGSRIARRIGIADIGGAYLLAALGVAVAAGIVLVALRPDPLLTARAADPAAGTKQPSRPRLFGRGGSLRLMWAHPGLRLALVALTVSQFVMTAIMVLTPVHMSKVGHDLGNVGVIMSVHIFGMYAFAPVVGWLVDRFGALRTIVSGTVVLGLSLAGSLIAGDNFIRLAIALFLLGVGWSLCAVAGAALVTNQAPADNRIAIQGGADTATNLAAALAAAAAGPVMGLVGYSGLSIFAAIVLALLVWHLVTDRAAVQPSRVY